MARKTKTVIITNENRDKGKAYFLTEMPVAKAEKWAARALLAIAKVAGAGTPDAIDGVGGLAGLSLSDLAQVNWELAEPLMDEMMGCVRFQPNSADPGVTRALIENADDIEEVSTMFTLRKEILALHFGFFANAGVSTSDTRAQSPATS